MHTIHHISYMYIIYIVFWIDHIHSLIYPMFLVYSISRSIPRDIPIFLGFSGPLHWLISLWSAQKRSPPDEVLHSDPSRGETALCRIFLRRGACDLGDAWPMPQTSEVVRCEAKKIVNCNILKNKFNWLVVWNMNFMTFRLSIIYGMSSFPNWRTPWFFRGVGFNHQLVMFLSLTTH